MSKYEFDLSVGIKEVLDADSAKKVESQIEDQKKRIEEPVEINVDVDSNAIKKLDKLTKAVRENRKALKNALASDTNIDEVSNLVNTHKQLEKQIKAVTKQVKGNSKEVGASKRALTDAKKLIDWYRELIFSANGDNEKQLMLINALDRSLYLYIKDNKYKRGIRKIITDEELTFEDKNLIKEVNTLLLNQEEINVIHIEQILLTIPFTAAFFLFFARNCTRPVFLSIFTVRTGLFKVTAEEFSDFCTLTS